MVDLTRLMVKGLCIGFVSLTLFIPGFKRTFDLFLDSFARLRRHGRRCRVLVVAALRGHPQEVDLLSVTRTPHTQEKMKAQSDSPEQRQGTVERIRLQTNSLLAVG